MSDDTRKDCMRLFDTREYYFIWFGACRLALSLIDLIGDLQNDRKLNNAKFIKNTLDFLMKSKSDMLTYIMNSGQGGITFKIAPVRNNKGKSIKEYKPYKMIYSEFSTPEVYGTEFISEEEHKWRDTARILMNALNNAAVTVSMISGRSQNEVFNSFLGGAEIEAANPGSEDTGKLITDTKTAGVKISKTDIPVGETPQPSIIMDFFSGAATTAHAVMQLNAEEGGDRRYIMVQSQEPCDEKSEAYKAGYKNIAEIGKERIRRAAKKIASENPNAHFDGGFKVFKIDKTKDGEAPFAPHTGIIGKQEFFSTILNHAGLPADTPLTEINICGARFWSANSGRLIFADEAGTTIEQAQGIISLKPEKIVLIKADYDVMVIIKKYLSKHEKIHIKSTH